MPRIWRVVPRTDSLGNQLWSLQYDPVFSGEDGDVTYGLWQEVRPLANSSALALVSIALFSAIDSRLFSQKAVYALAHGMHRLWRP